jgi:hypothetical protein
MRLRISVFLASAIALFAGCSQSTTEKYKAELIAADKAFCAASVKQGPQAAFLGVISKEGKLLGDKRGQTGPDAVRSMFVQLPPTATLTWDPSFVDVSSSGDLGYTWGRYMMTIPTGKLGSRPIIRMGTYVTIWKRQLGGGWKVVLDGGSADAVK